MELKSLNSRRFKLGVGLIFIAAITLIGCGGGGSSANNTPANTALTPAQIAAITPAQIAAYSDAQIVSLGGNIKYLSDSALVALSPRIAGSSVGQIQSLTAVQIAALSPSQIRMIGASGPGGTVGISQIAYLNAGAWAMLVSDPVQVAAITAAEIATFSDAEITAFGVNINALTNEALAALSPSTCCRHDTGQIQSISAAQIAALSPAQVRFIGSTGAGGATTTSQISALNSGAWAALASDPLQVSAITAAEIATFTDAQITALGTNINSLTNAALGALSSSTCCYHFVGQIQSISAAQIAALSPAQVRFIGSTGVGGATTTSQISALNSGAWAALVSDSLQVAAISAAEIATLTDVQVAAIGVKFGSLSDAALGAFTYSLPSVQQIQAITAVEIGALSPSQISVIAGIGANSGIVFLNAGAFGALSAAQIAVLTPAQKTNLSPAQHTSCGC